MIRSGQPTEAPRFTRDEWRRIEVEAACGRDGHEPSNVIRAVGDEVAAKAWCRCGRVRWDPIDRRA